MKPLRKPKKPRVVDLNPINPNLFYRKIDARGYFGLRPTQLSERIKSGDIPPPISISDNGRACGWFGHQILAWQRMREEKAIEQHQRTMEEWAREQEAKALEPQKKKHGKKHRAEAVV